MKIAVPSGGAPPDHLQIEIDTCLLKRQLESHEAEDNIARNRDINDGEDENGGEDNDDWEQCTHGAPSANCLAKHDFDGVNEARIC